MLLINLVYLALCILGLAGIINLKVLCIIGLIYGIIYLGYNAIVYFVFKVANVLIEGDD